MLMMNFSGSAGGSAGRVNERMYARVVSQGLFTADIGQPEPEFQKDVGDEKVGDPEPKLDDHDVAVSGI
jgi:hypothetical protein